MEHSQSTGRRSKGQYKYKNIRQEGSQRNRSKKQNTGRSGKYGEHMKPKINKDLAVRLGW